MPELAQSQIDEVLDAVAQRLTGEWVLIGGALVAVWLESRRTTEDIDLVGLRGVPEERYALMGLAADLGLPIESVNSAADFFLHRIAGWRDELRVLRQGKATIYRPTTTLFLLLKLSRLSARDLADCEAAIARAAEPVDDARLTAALDALPATTDADLTERRRRLRASLTA